MATGQSTISIALTISKIALFKSMTVSSQPPHDPNQQIATFSLSIIVNYYSALTLLSELLCISNSFEAIKYRFIGFRLKRKIRNRRIKYLGVWVTFYENLNNNLYFFIG